MKEIVFKKCMKCGAFVKEIENPHNSQFICCGEEMSVVVPNSVDASHEKHIPDIHVEDETMIITVHHVMEPEHYIEWILVKTEKENREVILKPGDTPEMTVPYEKGALIYAYCNKHGLWKTVVE